MSRSCARVSARSLQPEKREKMFELRIQECLLRGDSSALGSVLLDEGLSSFTLTKLDHFVTTNLSGSGLSRVQVVLRSLEALSARSDVLQTLIQLGLTAKVLLWFEALYNLLISDLQISSAPLLNITEEFYNIILLLGQASLPVSQLSVVFLQLARYALETKIHFPLRLEAIRTFNSVLESLSREQRKLIQNEPNLKQILSEMAALVLTAGDYELQVSLTEALCRLTPRRIRQPRANQWFARDISDAFCTITDADFEVDCRRFLNFVNRHHGNQKRIYTFPCLRAYLNSTEIFRPQDEKMDEFWIDFNSGSECVSFFTDDPQGFLWGTIHLFKKDVDHYRVQLKPDECTGGEIILSVHLKDPIMHQNNPFKTVKLSFNSELYQQLEEAAYRVFKKHQSSSPHASDSGGSVQVSSPANRQSGRSYSRKKPSNKSQLRVLPLSSPGSEEDSRMRTPVKSSAEFLFDQIRHSTPTYSSGVPVGVELQVYQKESEEFGDSSPPIRKEVVKSDRKRAAADSGYLSEQTEGASFHKKWAEPQTEGEEFIPSPIQLSPEEAESAAEEAEQFEEPINPSGKREDPVKELGAEPKSDLTSGITAAFNTFKTNVEQQFTSSLQNVEAQVLFSLKQCQQHFSDLLTAVHQHRLLLLQRFEVGVHDQLKVLQESSDSLSSTDTQILSFFQSEMQRLSSFCDSHLHRLKSLDNEGSSVDVQSDQ
ncbi:synaptonemal complex protein 2-like isoform X1 [Xyrichtys novacula]|uniref:Synaptonemal complex protein 2-like isoform X1 n=1 Tax=Xyrichtys novacula TaxID=13765 RepID=A0AAV1H7N1_XYRNO|nr:synaptonemal complex protein 2-like isoform X1 [Xyrichtys novacula]